MLRKMSKSTATQKSIDELSVQARRAGRLSEIAYWKTRHQLALIYQHRKAHMLNDETVEAIAREFCMLEHIDPDALAPGMNKEPPKNWELYVPEIRRMYNIISAIERYTK